MDNVSYTLDKVIQLYAADHTNDIHHDMFFI